jgi:hypothetical protein
MSNAIWRTIGSRWEMADGTLVRGERLDRRKNRREWLNARLLPDCLYVDSEPQ